MAYHKNVQIDTILFLLQMCYISEWWADSSLVFHCFSLSAILVNFGRYWWIFYAILIQNSLWVHLLNHPFLLTSDTIVYDGDRMLSIKKKDIDFQSNCDFHPHATEKIRFI